MMNTRVIFHSISNFWHKAENLKLSEKLPVFIISVCCWFCVWVNWLSAEFSWNVVAYW